jgi:hypothetical protein
MDRSGTAFHFAPPLHLWKRCHASRATTASFRALWTGVLVLACLVARPRDAEAFVQGVLAYPCFVRSITLNAGQSVQLSTESLSAGADSVLQLWDLTTDQRVAWSDDRSVSDLSSSLAYTNPNAATRSYFLFMHSALPPTTLGPGTARLFQNGQDVTGVMSLSCGVVDVGDGAGYVHETVQLPGGSPTGFIGLLDSSGRMIAWDQFSGLGNQARLSSTSGTRYALVGSYITLGTNVGSYEALRLVSNQPANDQDGDGLSSAVEASMGTCDNATTHAYCSGVFNPRDTDRDGLSDFAEVMGVDLQTAGGAPMPQLLPAWGSHPLQKDMFIEMDWASTLPFDPFSAPTTTVATISTFARAVQAFYRPTFSGPNAAADAAANAASLGNLNGLPGVRIHLDIGRQPADVADQTLFGAWGGSSECNQIERTPALTSPQCMEQARRGYFRYALALPGCCGQAEIAYEAMQWGVGGLPAPGGGLPAPEFDAELFAHELGHTAGLEHFGSRHFGGAQLNCSPFYSSIMNYCADQASTFSSGDANDYGSRSASVREIISAAWASWLPGSPWFRTGNPSSGTVDWDFDGSLGSSSSTRRAPLNTAHLRGDQGIGNEQTMLVIEDPPFEAIGSPAIAEGPGSRLYVFYINQSLSLRYRSSPHSGLSNGGCPNGDGWPAFQGGSRCSTVSGFQHAVPTPVGDQVVSVSATFWQGRLHVAWRTTSGAVRSRSTASVSAADQLNSWSPTVTHVAGAPSAYVAQGQISLSVWNTTTTAFGANQVLGLMFSAAPSNTYQYSYTTAFNQPWTPPGGLVTTGWQSIPGGAGVSATPWPSAAPPAGTTGRATACAAFAAPLPGSGMTSFPQGVRMFCLDPNDQAARWQEVSLDTMSAATPLATMGPPSLVFRPSRQATGHPAWTTQRGVFWLTTLLLDPPNTPVFTLSNGLTTQFNGSPLTSAWWMRLEEENGVPNFFDYWQNQFARAVPWTSVVLYDSPNIGAMKAVWRQQVTGGTLIRLDPLADGSLDAETCDGNDWVVLARRICEGLRRTPPLFADTATWCGEALTHEQVLLGPFQASCN